MMDSLQLNDAVLPIQFAQGLVRAAALSGISVDEVLELEKIDLDKLSGLPISKVATIVAYLVERSPITTIFPMMSVINDEAITEMLTISSTSRNLIESLGNLMECGPFSALGVDMHYQVFENHDEYIVDCFLSEGLSRLFLIEVCMAAFIRFLPSQFHPQSIIELVEFEFEAAGNPEEYELFFKCPVYFGKSRNRIQLSKNVIDADILSYSPILLDSAMEMLREKADILMSLQGYRFRASQAVIELLEENRSRSEKGKLQDRSMSLSIETIANRLGLNVRSLQRKLKQEGCSFIDCKNQTLIAESKKWMDHGQTNIDLIAETLGFSDRAAFSKVFMKYEKIWPAQYIKK